MATKKKEISKFRGPFVDRGYRAGLTDRQRRYIRRRVRSNNIAAIVFFLSSLFFLSIYILIALGLFSAEVTNIENGTQFVAAKFMVSEEEIIEEELRLVAVAATLMSVHFLGCLALRRGDEERVKGGWMFLYIIGLIAVVAGYFVYVLQTNYSGDVNLFVQGISEETQAFNVLSLAATAIMGFITLILAWRSNVFEGKTLRVKEKENGKLHGGVCMMYVWMCLSSAVFALLMGIALIVIKRTMENKQDDNDYDVVPDSMLIY